MEQGITRMRNFTWVAYAGGPRESRRLLGDVILTEEDIVSKRDFPDGCVPSAPGALTCTTPKSNTRKSFPTIRSLPTPSTEKESIDRTGTPFPIGAFIRVTLKTCFMAGRCISVTHEALGTVRVMKTCGMMGEVVGRAASICIQRDCLPREVYNRYLDDLIELINFRARPSEPPFTIRSPFPPMPWNWRARMGLPMDWIQRNSRSGGRRQGVLS